MIINLKGEVSHDGEINFDLPPVYFTEDQYVHATEIFLRFDKQVTHPNGYITTNLIEKSIVNQTQQLIFFQQSAKSGDLYFTPLHIAEYKIRQHCLDNGKFKLLLFDKNNNLDFRKLTVQVYLQLKITVKTKHR